MIGYHAKMNEISSPTAESNRERRFLFLCGVGRSGTTILRRSLGLHPDIYYNGQENNLVQDLIEVAQKNCTQPSRKIAMVVDQQDYDAAFQRLTIDLLWPDPLLQQRPVLMAAINPTGDLLSYLAQVFSPAKFVGLVRNGIEVVQSRTKYNSFSHLEFEQHCETWLRCAGVVDWGDRHPDQFRLFRHEWMYEPDLDHRFSQLFQWLGIGHHAAVAERIVTNLTHPTSDSGTPFSSMSPEEKSAYFDRKRAAWYSWDANQQTTFRSLCGPLMERLGYLIPDWDRREA